MYIVGFDAKSITQNAITLAPETSLMDARNTMIKYNISRVVVAKGGKPVGIITEKDIARFLYSEVPSRRLSETALSEIMSIDLITVDEDSDQRKCAKAMLQKGVSSLVVVNAKNRLKGILTKSDLIHGYVENFAGEHLVKAFMTRKVLTVAPDEPVHMAIMLINGNEISRVVVVNTKRQPVGIITTHDLLPFSSLFGTGTADSYWPPRKDVIAKKRKQSFIPSGIKAAFMASDIMTSNPIVIRENADLADAGYIMLRNRISGLPVVGSNGKLKGIITKTDIVKALASHA